jgi:hypothetical protein
VADITETPFEIWVEHKHGAQVCMEECLLSERQVLGGDGFDESWWAGEQGEDKIHSEEESEPPGLRT